MGEGVLSQPECVMLLMDQRTFNSLILARVLQAERRHVQLTVTRHSSSHLRTHPAAAAVRSEQWPTAAWTGQGWWTSKRGRLTSL